MVSKNKPIRLDPEVARMIKETASEMKKSTAEVSREIFKNTKKIFTIVFSIYILLSLMQFSNATGTITLIGNGSFETGDLTSWSTDCTSLTVAGSSDGSITPAFGSWLVDADVPASSSCSLESATEIEKQSTVCMYLSTSANASQKASIYIGGEFIRTVSGNGGWGDGAEFTRNRPPLVPEPDCFEIDNNSGVLRILFDNQVGAESHYAVDYVTAISGSNVYPAISTITQTPSPVDKDDTVRIDTTTKGITQKLRCGTAQINDVNRDMVGHTFDELVSFPFNIPVTSLGGNYERASTWAVVPNDTRSIQTVLDASSQLDGIYSIADGYSVALEDQGIRVMMNNDTGNQEEIVAPDNETTIGITIAANSTAKTDFYFASCENGDCVTGAENEFFNIFSIAPGVTRTTQGVYYIDYNVTGLGNTDVNLWVDNLRFQGKRVDIGTELCVTDNWVDDPYCEFANTFTAATTIYCEVFNQGGDKWVVSHTLEGNPEAANEPPEINASITPTSPDTNDNLVPTVTITYEEPEILDNNYVWQYRSTSKALLWQTFSSGLLSRIASTDSYTAPTISSSDTNAGNLWRLKIISTDGNVTSTGFSNIVGINVDTSLLTCLTNCSKTEFFDAVTGVYNFIITPGDKDEDITFKINNIDTVSIDANITIKNDLIDGKQYFISTSDEDGNYVFNDSLTYGTLNSFDDPIQKIWHEADAEYKYLFNDTIIAAEEKFFELNYRFPMGYWEIVQNDPDWFLQLNPHSSIVNGKLTDIYTLSHFSNMKNILIQPIPEFVDTVSVPYEFQFTAFVSPEFDSNTVLIKVGTIDAADVETTNTITVTKTAKRFSVPVEASSFEDQLLVKSDLTIDNNAVVINITDYALINRGYFTKRLELKQSDNSELPVIVLSTIVSKYLLEGKNFRVDTEAYDRDGDINYLKIEAYLDTVHDVNRVRVYWFDLNTSVEETIIINELLEGIIDLSGSASNPSTPRQVRIRAILVDSNRLAVATQSKWITFIQYPYFPKDIEINFTQDARKVGENPKGILNLTLTAPETLIGVRLNIWDEDSSKVNSDYNKIFYKDTDFECHAFYCSFDYFIDDWKFKDQNIYGVQFVTLINTELYDANNSLLHHTKFFFIKYRDYETLRVFETFERLDHTYRSDEEIPVVLQVREVGDYGTWANIKNDVRVYMRIANCDADVNATCQQQSNRYPADSFLYDEETGYNYFFFRQLFLMDDGSLFPDANYMRFVATIEDVETVRSTARDAFMTRKCQADDRDTDCSSGGIPGAGTCFFNNMLSTLNHFTFGCTTVAPLIVATGTNEGLELRLLIDEDHSLTTPTQECFACLNTDINNLYASQLKQDLLCASWYTIGENPIDSMTLAVTNKHSDLSEDDPAIGQYLKVNIPYELVAFNDITLLKKMLETNQNTTINSLGDAIIRAFNELFTSYATYSAVRLNFNTIQSITPNIGFDCNFDKPFDPANVTGLLFYKIKGLEVHNMEDFRNVEDIEFVDPVNFMKFVKDQELNVPDKETHITVYASDFEKILDKDIVSNLVINEKSKDQKLNIENVDVNNIPNFRNIPTILKFNLISDLAYGGHVNVIRRYVPIRLQEIIVFSFQIGDINEIINQATTDPIGFFVLFLFDNIVIITILLMIGIVLSIIIANLLISVAKRR